MKKITLIALAAAALLAGCNTVSGVGKDVSAVGSTVGNAVTNTADHVKESLQ